MSVKRPKSHRSHTYNREAFLNLTSIFPSHWKIINSQDAIGNIEYGADWIVQLTDEQNGENFVTGILFIIQSKVVEKTPKSRYISCSIETSTLNLLVDYPIPVLFHFYDLQEKIGYWLWLAEFLVNKPVTNWRNKKKVTVSIPKTNVLDQKAVESIQTYVAENHDILNNFKNAQLLSRNPGFSFATKFNMDDNKIITYITPRRSNAPSFHLILTPENADKFQKSLEIGEGVEIEGIIDGLPILSAETKQPGKITFTPSIPDKAIFLNIQYVDISGTILQEIPLPMKVLRYGTKLIQMQGTAIKHHAAYTLTTDKQNNQIIFNIMFNLESNDPVEWNNLLESTESLFDKLHSIRIENLEDGTCFVLDGTALSKKLNSFSPELRRLIKALARIAQKTNITIPIPHESFETTELLKAENIAEGLETGRCPRLIAIDSDAILSLTTTSNHVPHILSKLEGGGEITVGITFNENVRILGHEFNIGAFQNVFNNLRIANLDELQRYKLQQNISEGQEVIFEFFIDRNQSYTNLLEWPKRDDILPTEVV